MSDRAFAILQSLARPAYFVAVLLVVTPLVDLGANIWPPRLGAEEWRFGAFGLLSGFLLTPLLGVVLAAAAAAVLGHRGVQRGLAVLNLAGAALLAAVFLMLALDWLQTRASIEPVTRPAIDIGSIKALAKHVTVGLALLWLGVVGWRESRRAAPGRSRDSAPLMH